MDVSRYQAGISHPALAAGMPAVAGFPLNERGRDLVVGDVHGMFAHLERLLDMVEFDVSADRLFSVGDLVDRGPNSRATLKWLAHPWFHACRGNHEQFVLDSDSPHEQALWTRSNGGAWWLALGAEEQGRFREAIARLPFALEIATASGLTGIVHADVPPMLSWDEFMALLSAGNPEAMLYAMWSRRRLQFANQGPVTGRVERVYCGHTPTRGTVRLGNVFHIDTGAVYAYENFAEAGLTMVEVHPRAHREYAIATVAGAGFDP